VGLLSREPSVSIDECCRKFYDSQIFNPIIGGTDVGLVFLQHAYNSVAEADKRFKNIDFSKFQEEVNALRMELFALAWMERFKGEQYTLPQSFFTKSYLQEINRAQIWDIMGEYNQVIARSATMTDTGKQLEGRLGRARITQINLLRFNTYKRWSKAYIGNKEDMTAEDEGRAICIGRVINRIGADIKRGDCIGANILSGRLAERVGCDFLLSSEAFSRLGGVTLGLYEGAKEAIKNVNIQSS